MLNAIEFEFQSHIWIFKSNKNGNAVAGSWHFISLPLELSVEIRSQMSWQEEGWGRLKVRAQLGGTIWSTAIWYDSKHATYLLPIKSDVRKKEKLLPGDLVSIKLWI